MDLIEVELSRVIIQSKGDQQYLNLRERRGTRTFSRLPWQIRHLHVADLRQPHWTGYGPAPVLVVVSPATLI